MRYFLFLAVLPYIWAKELEVKNIICPDGNECPFGKTCHPLPSGAFECVDLPEEELQNKKLSPALQSGSVNQNVSLAPTKMHSWCSGTECGYLRCCEAFINAECCSDNAICCASNGRCCSNSYTTSSWCCLKSQRCHSDYGYCRNAAASAQASLVYLLCFFFVGMVSKYLF